MDHTPLVDDAGNAPELWLVTAGDLLASRDSLARRRCDAEEAAKALPMPRRIASEARSYWVELMLVGFAIENMLKALWLLRGGMLYAQGKLQRIKGVESHDLPAIADHIGFSLSDTEKHHIEILPRIMTGIGRYPMEARPDSKAPCESWSNIADDVVLGLIDRLREVIRNEEAA
jgi:hypothetical protein